MHTPMAQTGDIFVAKVQVPPSAIIDFAFLITKTNDGANTKIWDRADDFRRIATTNGVIDIDPKARVAQDPVQSEPHGNISESSVLMQEFRNHKVYWLILAFLAFGISVLISLKLRKTI
jgi:hypothetical protein